MNAGLAILDFLNFLVGFILLIGNKTGWWPTFPFAGFIVMLIGGLMMKGAIKRVN